MQETIVIRVGNERAKLYPAGGIGFEELVLGVGWCVNESPSLAFERLVFAMWAVTRPAREQEQAPAAEPVDVLEVVEGE